MKTLKKDKNKRDKKCRICRKNVSKRNCKKGGNPSNPLFKLDEEQEYEDERVRLGYENFRELEEVAIRNNAGFDHPFLSRQIFEYAYRNPKQLFCDEMVAMYPDLRMLIENLLRENVRENEDNDFFSIDILTRNGFMIQIKNRVSERINLPLSDFIVRHVSRRLFEELHNRRLKIKQYDVFGVVMNITLYVSVGFNLSTAGIENVTGYVIGVTNLINRPSRGRGNKMHTLSLTW